jgi:hypothetical protein
MINPFRNVNITLLIINYVFAILLFYFFVMYVLVSVQDNYQFPPLILYSVYAVCGLTFMALGTLFAKEEVEEDPSYPQIAEEVITGEIPGIHYTPEELGKRIILALSLARKRMKLKDWNEAWAYCQEAEALLSKMENSQQRQYREEVNRVRTMYEHHEHE